MAPITRQSAARGAHSGGRTKGAPISQFSPAVEEEVITKRYANQPPQLRRFPPPNHKSWHSSHASTPRVMTWPASAGDQRQLEWSNRVRPRRALNERVSPQEVQLRQRQAQVENERQQAQAQAESEARLQKARNIFDDASTKPYMRENPYTGERILYHDRDHETLNQVRSPVRRVFLERQDAIDRGEQESWAGFGHDPFITTREAPAAFHLANGTGLGRRQTARVRAYHNRLRLLERKNTLDRLTPREQKILRNWWIKTYDQPIETPQPSPRSHRAKSRGSGKGVQKKPVRIQDKPLKWFKQRVFRRAQYEQQPIQHLSAQERDDVYFHGGKEGAKEWRSYISRSSKETSRTS